MPVTLSRKLYTNAGDLLGRNPDFREAGFKATVRIVHIGQTSKPRSVLVSDIDILADHNTSACFGKLR